MLWTIRFLTMKLLGFLIQAWCQRMSGICIDRWKRGRGQIFTLQCLVRDAFSVRPNVKQTQSSLVSWPPLGSSRRCHQEHGFKMMSREEWTFQEWLSAYMDEYHRPPEDPNYLCAFAQHRGGHLVYRVARERLKEPQKEAPTLQRSLSWAYDGLEGKLRVPVLQRFRSDKMNADALLRGMPSSSYELPQKRLANKSPLQLAKAVLDICYRRVAEREAKKSTHTIMHFGRNGNHSMDEQKTKCAICLEFHDCIQTAGDLCRERDCRGWFCSPCLQKHVATIIEDTRFSVPHIRCPSCFGFVPPSCWQQFSEEKLRSQWKDNAADLLSIRCGDCDEPGSLLQTVEELDESKRENFAKTVLETFSIELSYALVEKWYLFEKGVMSAHDLVAALLSLWGANDLDPEESPSFAEEFATAMKLVEDDGLRAILQLAMLKRFPKTLTACCESAHCFRCKVHTHHEGTSCEQIMAEQMPEQGVQFCPGCGVATVRTEGCNHIICLCGENWTWDGDEE